MPSKDPLRGRRYRQAGLAYGVLGFVVIVLTVATPELARPERREDLVRLVVGLPIFVVFALAIAYGDRTATALARALRVAPERARRFGAGCQRVLVAVLTLTALTRTLVFAANGVGLRLRFGEAGFRFEQVAAEPRMFVNAMLMAVVCLFLARAAATPARRA